MGKAFDPDIYIEWSDGDVSIIQSNLNKVLDNIDDLLCVSTDVFLFNLTSKYVIEIRRNGEVTIGVI